LKELYKYLTMIYITLTRITHENFLSDLFFIIRQSYPVLLKAGREFHKIVTRFYLM